MDPDLNNIIENQQQMQAAITHLCGMKSEVKCKHCNKPHNSRKPSGAPWNYCQECHINVIKKRPPQHRPTYNSPAVSRRPSGRCQDCNKEATIGRTGNPMPRCRDC